MSRIKNINATIKSLRLLLIIIVPLMLFAIVYQWVIISSLVKDKNETVYVVGEKMLMSAHKLENQKPTALVAAFSEYWMKTIFQHDQFTYTDNVEKAMNYITEAEGNKIKRGLEEAKILEEYIENNAWMTLIVDSIGWVSTEPPYELVVYQHRYMNYGSGHQKKQNFTMKLTVNPIISNTEENKFGLMINDFLYIGEQ